MTFGMKGEHVLFIFITCFVDFDSHMKFSWYKSIAVRGMGLQNEEACILALLVNSNGYSGIVNPHKALIR